MYCCLQQWSVVSPDLPQLLLAPRPVQTVIFQHMVALQDSNLCVSSHSHTEVLPTQAAQRWTIMVTHGAIPPSTMRMTIYGATAKVCAKAL